MGDWRDDAGCVGVPTEMFFREGHHNGKDRQSMTVKAICFACPVREECLADALHHERNVHRSERAGIWGGLGPGERYRLWKKIKPLNDGLCKEGHVMNEENIYQSPSGDVYCRQCRRMRREQYRPPKTPVSPLVVLGDHLPERLPSRNEISWDE